jgi:hypothetical protein
MGYSPVEETDLYSRAVTVKRNDTIISPTEERTSVCEDEFTSEDGGLMLLFASGSVTLLKGFGQSTCRRSTIPASHDTAQSEPMPNKPQT